MLPPRIAAEFIGTAVLVFAGTSAVVMHQADPSAVSNLGVALTFGMVVAAMICAVGGVSGAHINPAVTLGFWVSRRIDAKWGAAYAAAQCAGAVVASVAVRLLFPTSETLGATLPVGGELRSFVLEGAMTFVLVFVVLSVAAVREGPLFAAVAVGAVVGMQALFGGPVSGASMNPARSLGPALISGALDSLWIYWTAPFLGGLAAVAACRAARGRGCCGKEACA